MPNECGECGAKLKADQTKCSYCRTPVFDTDEQLLMELTTIIRNLNEAMA